MSDGLEKVVDRAVKDEAFRNLLLNEPGKALADYQITDEERTLLEGLTPETFTTFAGSLSSRSTKGSWTPGIG